MPQHLGHLRQTGDDVSLAVSLDEIDEIDVIWLVVDPYMTS